MPYEVKERNGQYFVVDTTTKRIRGTYDDEDKAEDRKDDLDFRETVRGRLERIPVAEMTAEEKAAAYDKMMAEKDKTPDPNVPPKKDDKVDPPKTKKHLYWGDQLED
jgi:hypothetical protein